MSRGFGNKAERTYKCDCDNPQWSVFEFHKTKLGDKYVITLTCSNCNALWETRTMTDAIFDMLTDNQREAFFKVMETQIQHAQSSIDELTHQIESLKAICNNAQAQIRKNNELIEHYKSKS